MEVAISPASGGISGVYSGASRGNRFSLRLVRHDSKHKPTRKSNASLDQTEMRCSRMEVTQSTPAMGCIEARGEIIDTKQSSKLASFCLRYTLHTGSRLVRIDGQLTPDESPRGDPWQNYFACRAAVAMEAAIYRSLLRDKIHRTRSRRMVAPLGVMIDEAERQTLVGAAGLAFHRRVGERFLDTLLITQGESNQQFTLFYGFDVSAPVGAARSLIVPPVRVPISSPQGVSNIGWIIHSAPKEVLVSSLSVDRRRDGKLAAAVRLIHTRSQSCKASIRFLRDVQCGLLLDGSVDDPLNHPLPATQPDGSQAGDEGDRPSDTENGLPAGAKATQLDTQGDLVSLSIAAHGVADLVVVFVDDTGA
jgi:alpha-mannosidase